MPRKLALLITVTMMVGCVETPNLWPSGAAKPAPRSSAKMTTPALATHSGSSSSTEAPGAAVYNITYSPVVTISMPPQPWVGMAMDGPVEVAPAARTPVHAPPAARPAPGKPVQAQPPISGGISVVLPPLVLPAPPVARSSRDEHDGRMETGQNPAGTGVVDKDGVKTPPSAEPGVILVPPPTEGEKAMSLAATIWKGLCIAAIVVGLGSLIMKWVLPMFPIPAVVENHLPTIPFLWSVVLAVAGIVGLISTGWVLAVGPWIGCAAIVAGIGFWAWQYYLSHQLVKKAKSTATKTASSTTTTSTVVTANPVTAAPVQPPNPVV